MVTASVKDRLLARLVDFGVCLILILFVNITIPITFSLLYPSQYQNLVNFQEKLITSENGSDLEETFDKLSRQSECNYSDDNLKEMCRENQGYLIQMNIWSSFISFILTNSYFVLLTISSWQATLGKRLLNLKVVGASSKKVTLLEAFSRELFWILQGLFLTVSFLYDPFAELYVISWMVIGLSFSKAFFSQNKRMLHDYISYTKVLKIK
jgi:hypothetical protein